MKRHLEQYASNDARKAPHPRPLSPEYQGEGSQELEGVAVIECENSTNNTTPPSLSRWIGASALG